MSVSLISLADRKPCQGREGLLHLDASNEPELESEESMFN